VPERLIGVEHINLGVKVAYSADVAGSPIVLLDVGGVVFKSAWEMLAEYEVWSGLAPGTLRWRGKFDPDNDEFWRDYVDGKTTERVYWQRFSEACEAVGARRDQFGSVMAAIHMGGYGDIVRPEVRGLLADLRDSELRYGIFTNDLVHLFGSEWPQTFPEISNAEWFIDANAAGALKPEAAAFKAATDIVGMPADRIVFVDDDHLNIEAATTFGMIALLLDVTAPHRAIAHVRTLLGHV
jgi:putative hydrolase of the HAD superfamily